MSVDTTAAHGAAPASMKVPLLDLSGQLDEIRTELKQVVDEVIESTRYIGGPKIEQLEREIAEYVGADYGVGVTSGTDALLVSLMALDVGPGDLVVTTAYSFFATAGVIGRLNAKAVFIDIDPISYNIDPRALRAWFEGNPDQAKQVKAIVPVHLYGQCADMDPILELAKEFNVAVVEDAAQAIGSSYPSSNGLKRAGSMGDFGCFSFFPSKNLGAIGDGGMVVTSDEKKAEKLRMLRNHGAQPKYYHSMIGGNFRLDPIQAAALSVKLKHLDKWHAMRRSNAEFYDQAFKIPQVSTPKVVYERKNHIYNQYIISVERDRDELRQHLQECNIGVEVYYPVSFHDQACFANLGYKRGDFPRSEYAADHTLALPIYPELTDEMQAYVVQQIGKYYE